MTSDKPAKRLVLPEKRTQADLRMGMSDISVDTMMTDAMETLAVEISRFRVKVGRGNTLDIKESRILQGYLDTLLKMKKELREEERDSKMDKLSNEELLLLAKKVLADGGSNIIETTSEQQEDDQADE
jgi:hypothetical protein